MMIPWGARKKLEKLRREEGKGLEPKNCLRTKSPAKTVVMIQSFLYRYETFFKQSFEAINNEVRKVKE